MASWRPAPESLLRVAAWASAAMAVGILFLIAAFVVAGASPLLTPRGLRDLAGSSWEPGEGAYGLAAMVAATAVVSAASLLLAAPPGLATALVCHRLRRVPAGRALRALVGVFAGVPSVVYGLWGLTWVVPWLGAIRPPGASSLAGALVLGLMLVPTVALLSETSLATVDRNQIRAAAALGLHPRAVERRVALPLARRGIAAALVLALARALGETMVVLMVCGNVVRVPWNPLSPVRPLTANIALEMAYAEGPHRSALFAGGLAVLAISGVMVWTATGARGCAVRDPRR